MVRTLEPAVHGESADDVLLAGPSGVGKTVLARYVLRRLEAVAADVATVRVQCLGLTDTDILRAICKGVEIDPGDSWMVTDLQEVLLEDDRPKIVVLDEADDCPDTGVITHLSSIPGLSVVAITHDPADWVTRLDAAHRHRYEGDGVIAVFGVVTREWVGVVFSLGIVGFAITFALQQPLFSLIGWLYIVSKRPYQVGDRIAIEEMRGDVVSIDFFATEVWEIGGDLVSSNQPSGRIVTVPNSTILSARVVNFYGEGVQYVWNELSIQVAYETDLSFASEVMIDVASEHLGDEMARGVSSYRRRLAETPAELDVNDGPTVNVVQGESWVELRLRYLVHPRRGTRARNALYEAILDRFNDHPERVKFPMSRNR